MTGCWSPWVVGVKLWLIVGGGGKLMPGRGWSWVVTTKLWLVVAFRGWSHNLVMLNLNIFSSLSITRKK